MRLKEGQAVWVKDSAIAKENLYNVGHVVSVDGNKVTVETEQGGKRQEIVVTAEECFHTNQGPDVPDHCQLVHLSPPTLLENTRIRFENDKIYTYVGDILVAVNPFKWILGIYDESVMEQCKGKKLHNTACGPHVFSISERAFVTLRKSGKSQCVVVSGESGSGKTETNKQLMNFLVYRGSAQGGVSDLTQKILDTNPILESFGNAKTTRNKNSSRFGRYVLVRFSQDFRVIGAQVRTFLLERSRVTAATNDGERAYHVLYQLVYDGTYMQPNNPSAHRYLSLSGCIAIEGVDDVEEFKDLNKALESVGLTNDERTTMWGMVAAMLHLGSVGLGSGTNAAISDFAGVTKVEGLLGVSGLSELLVKRSIKIGAEVTRIEHNPQQASLARDALVKIMYARLFDFLVARINQTVDAEDKSPRYIGLLDVYGFEFFAVNSFEQLCINFANEKLQQFFLQTVFENEASAYKEEGVPWTPIPYADNKDIIILCEDSKHGIYPLLDSQCRTPNSSGKTFCAALHKTHAKSPVFAAPKVSRKETRSKDDHFIVKHFAGDVVYLAAEFLEKNNDSLDEDLEKSLLSSNLKLVVEVCTPEAEPVGAKAKKKSSFASVGDKFVKSLKGLMTELASSQAHFVRCIKPNPELKPNKLHGVSVIDQLRMSGTLDAVRLIQAGYPSRIPYDDLSSRYRSMMPANVQNLSAQEFCELIAAVCDIGKEEYALGVSRMFFRLGSAALLEDLGEMDPAEAEKIIKEKVAVFEKRKWARPVVEKTLQMWVHKRRYKVIVAEHRQKLEEERRRKEEEERKERERLAREAEETRLAEEADARRREEEDKKKHAEAAEAAALAKKAEEHHCSVAEEQKAEQKAAEQCSLQLQAMDASVHRLEEDHDDVHAAVASHGGITGVASMAQTHAASADVQAHFVGLMRDLCISDEIADEIADAGGIERILDAAHRHYDRPDVMMEVADSIRNLVFSESIAERASKGGAIEVLVDAATRHASNEAVNRAVVGALWALSVHDDCVAKLVKLGCVQSVIVAAKAMPKDEDVQSSAAALIRNLAINEQAKTVRWTVAEKGGISLLIAAAENHMQSAEVASQVACALWNLAQTADVAAEVAASGAIETLVAIAAPFAGDPTVQLGVTGCMRLVCVTDAAADHVVTARGVPVLMAASRNHMKRADVQRAFVGALLELATHGFAETVVVSGGINAVIKVAETHSKEERLQARAAGVLRLLATNDETKAEIGAMGGVQLLIGATKRFAQSAAVQADVAGALAVLAVDDELEAQIASAGGINTLLDALQRHQTSAAVAAHGWHALTNLSVSATTKRQIGEYASTKALISGALQLHAEAPRVIEGVATTLRNLCLPNKGGDIPDPAKFLDGTALQKLLAILKANMETTLVALALVGAIRAVVADASHALQFMSMGGRETLTDCNAQHRDDDRLMHEVESALRRIDDAAAGGDGSRASFTAAAKTHNVLGQKPKQTAPGSKKGTLGSMLTPKKEQDWV